MTAVPLRMSPSRIAHFFFQGCERFLRYSATPKQQRAAQGVPRPKPLLNSVSREVFKLGYQWEEEIVRSLNTQRVFIADGEGQSPLSERRFTLDDSLKCLREARPSLDHPLFIYQATLSAPPLFYKRYDLDPSTVSFSECHPDLIEVSLSAEGDRIFRVIDVKRSEQVKSTHRIQILIYALLLEATLSSVEIEGRVELGEGGVWLNEERSPTWVSIEVVRNHVERFLSEDLMRIAQNKAATAQWHLTHRCEWCEHFEHCLNQAHAENDLSRLPGLSALGKRYLNEQGINTLDELVPWLGDEEVDKTLSQSASLIGKRQQLLIQAEAFLNDETLILGNSTAVIPKTESVRVFITAQTESLTRRCYLVGLSIQFTKRTRSALEREASQLEGAQVWVAESPEAIDSEEAPICRAIDLLISLFETLDAYNHHREWSEQLSVQCYTHSQLERKAFESSLLHLLEHSIYGIKAAKLLLYFTSPESVLSDAQTEEPLAFPLTPVLNAQTRLLATPISVSPTLPESLATLGSSFEYERDDHVLYPLGHGFKPDIINEIWKGNGRKTTAYLKRAGKIQLAATASLLRAIRDRCIELLNTYPPKFTMPSSNYITDPLLSKLAFFTRYEELLSCLEVRSARDLEPEQAIKEGLCALIEVDQQKWFKVLNHPKKIEVGTFATGLLGADTKEGRKALLSFNDIGHRHKMNAKMKSPYFYPTSAKEIREDNNGRVTDILFNLSGKQYALLEPGDRFLYYPRYINFTADKIINALRDLDHPRGHDLMNLYREPSSLSLPLAPSVDTALETLLQADDFTPSQRLTFEALCHYQNVVLWGPPGTGKSYFISMALQRLFEAHLKAGLPLRVLITSFTHAAIENVLRSTVKRLSSSEAAEAMSYIKLKSWKGEERPAQLSICDPKGIEERLRESRYLLVGSTVYGCLSGGLEDCFDVVVIDEASQVKLNEATIAINTRKQRGGRLLLAGDHEQLPPITKNVWPEMRETPQLNQSILEALYIKGHPALGCMLEESFRMNDTLTDLVASKIYGSRYRPGNDQVAQQRLRWTPDSSDTDLMRLCLDPDYPCVIVSVEGGRAGQVGLEEAELTAELTESLQRGLVKSDHSQYSRGELFYGAQGHPSGLFIVSPHHVQIDAIKRSLSARSFLNPFVDTVDKMQGQEAECVFVSYGVSDAEFAMREAEFIYSRNRLNVSVTRAKSKVVLLVSRALLDAPPEILDQERALKGLEFLRHLYRRAASEDQSFHPYRGLTIEVTRVKG